MKYITKESLIDTLLSVGIEKNDTLLVHSDIAAFGTTENFSRKEALNIFYDAFMEVLGSEGTLCVPAYFYEYARFGIPYDIALSPVSEELGVFAKFINSLPESKRSCNPLAAVAKREFQRLDPRFYYNRDFTSHIPTDIVQSKEWKAALEQSLRYPHRPILVSFGGDLPEKFNSDCIGDIPQDTTLLFFSNIRDLNKAYKDLIMYVQGVSRTRFRLDEKKKELKNSTKPTHKQSPRRQLIL